MRNRLLVIGIITSLVSGTAMAASPSKEENIGVGAGVVVGAVAGGPVGAIVGAAIGAKLGDTFHRRGEKVEVLDESLRSSKASTARLRSDLLAVNKSNERLQDELSRLQEVSHPEFVSLLQAGIAMDLLFRTDEHVLIGETDSRLKSMATTLATMPDVSIRLDGYADERGAAEYNQTLSRMRAEHVRDVLLASGVPSDRIKVNANGESVAAGQDVDSYALERKVSLTLFVAESTSFASTP